MKILHKRRYGIEVRHGQTIGSGQELHFLHAMASVLGTLLFELKVPILVNLWLVTEIVLLERTLDIPKCVSLLVK